MRLAVFSDSHGDVSHLRQAIEEASKRKKVDLFVFLGDGIRDFLSLEGFMRTLNPDARVEAVRGNNDLLYTDGVDDMVLTLNGVNVLVTHGHKCFVKVSTKYLANEARKQNCAIALYGHTHNKDIRDMGGVWLMNPGAVAFFRPSALVIDIENDGSFTPELIDI